MTKISLLVFLSIFATMLPAQALDKKFMAVSALQFGATALDIELTQNCIRSHTCREGNPLMPSNRAGAYAVGFGIAGLETFTAYRFKKNGQRNWWIYPILGTSVHAYGIASGLRFH